MDHINFDKAFNNMCKGREEHEFRHYNNAIGCMIYSKAHLKHEMKRRNMVPTDEAERLAEQWDKDNPKKGYGDISPKAMDIIRAVKMTSDKHGNICLGDRAIEALRDIGALPKAQSEISQDMMECIQRG